MDEALVVFVRGIISFFTLLIFTRMLGKQQLGEITFFDYILGITIGSFGASLTADLGSSAWPHWIGLLTWILLGIFMQHISLNSKKMSDYINDEPTIVIHNGYIMGDNLKRVKYTLNDLLSQLRLRDIFDISKVKYAIIEPNGQVSIISCQDFDNLLDSMNIKVEKNINIELIFNGIFIENNIQAMNVSKEWIINGLKELGFNEPGEVFYAYIDHNNNLIADTYKDRIISREDLQDKKPENYIKKH